MDFLEESHYVNTGYLVTIYGIFLRFFSWWLIFFFLRHFSPILKQFTPLTLHPQLKIFPHCHA